MSEQRIVIFEAPTIDAAYRLRRILKREGIVAEVLAGFGPGSEDAEGLPIAARVTVDPQDARRARHFVRVFEAAERGKAIAHATHTHAEQAGAAEAASEDIPPGWPRCPECGTPRLTWCPICQTAGTRFEPADDVPPELFDELAAEASAARCRWSGCGRGAHAQPDADTQSPRTQAGGQGAGGDAETLRQQTEAESRKPRTEAGTTAEPAGAAGALKMVLCPTCDEPFVPQFARHCEWCGHEYADGIDFTPPPPDEDQEQLGPRAVAVIVALLALGALLVGYLVYLL